MRSPSLPRLACQLVLLSALSLQARPAAAYVPPAEALCQMLAEARRRTPIRDVSLQLSTEALEPEAQPDHQLEERLFLKRPERQRLLRQGERPQVRIDREGQMARLDDRLLKEGPLPSDNLLPVLLMPKGDTPDEQAARICSSLKAAGIDLNVVSLGRHSDGVAYIVGAAVFSPQAPQLWLDRATLHPLRIVLRHPASLLPTAAMPSTATPPAASSAAANSAGAPADADAAGAYGDGYPVEGPAAPPPSDPTGSTESLPPAAAATTSPIDPNVPPADDPGRYELRLRGYGEGPGGNSLPRIFDEYLGATLIRRAQVVQARFNQNLSEALFEWSPPRRR